MFIEPLSLVSDGYKGQYNYLGVGIKASFRALSKRASE